LWTAVFHLYAQTDSISYERPKKNPLIIELEMENGGILAAKEIRRTTFESAYDNGVNLKDGWKMQH